MLSEFATEKLSHLLFLRAFVDTSFVMINSIVVLSHILIILYTFTSHSSILLVYIWCNITKQQSSCTSTQSLRMATFSCDVSK